MNRNFRRFLLFFSLLFVIVNLVFSQTHAEAMDPNLVINYSGMPGPLFTIDNIKPLDSFSQIVSVTNNSTEYQTFSFNISSIIGDIPLADVLNLQVERNNNIFFDDTLSNLKNPDGRNIEIIPPSTTYDYNFIVTMQDVGNSYEGLKIKTADFVLGFNPAGEVLGARTGPENLPATGNNLIMTILISFIFSSLFIVLGNKKERAKFLRVFR
jgi:hypothetical protein